VLYTDKWAGTLLKWSGFVTSVTNVHGTRRFLGLFFLSTAHYLSLEYERNITDGERGEVGDASVAYFKRIKRY